MIDPHALYHVGFVVEDLDRSMAASGAGLGLRWASVQQRDVDVLDRGGNIARVVVPATYSVDGPVHVELLEERPGSPWVRGEGGATHHHVGYWVEDLRGTVEALGRSGWRFEASGVDGEGRPSRFCYLLDAAGRRIELVDVAVRPALERWLAGGEYVT